jgi:AcrR family transcriptional regulator
MRPARHSARRSRQIGARAAAGRAAARRGQRPTGGASDPRRPAALYPKLRPGPRPTAGESVGSNQRARLYGAMIELVAARGYAASTVADLCALAGVSKRTLYERFPGGKLHCFLASYDIVVRIARERILGAGPPREGVPAAMSAPQRLRVLAQAFAHEVAAHPNAARLVLVEPLDAGPVALVRAQRTRQLIERVVSRSLRERPEGPAPSQALVSSIVERGGRVVRARLREGRTAELLAELPEACLAALAAPSQSAEGRFWERSAAFRADCEQ